MFYGALWQLNLISMNWSALGTTTPGVLFTLSTPSARSRCGLIAWSASSLTLFGGYGIINDASGMLTSFEALINCFLKFEDICKIHGTSFPLQKQLSLQLFRV
jgi:hypothetical protein